MLPPPHRLPGATYRLQFTPEFTLEKGRELVPYLKQLGITEIYASPLFQASAESSHGYDVNDYNQISRALGGRPALERFSATLQDADMGLLLDFVPNHMGIDGEFNHWWSHVLENGPRSKYAGYFDIEWHPRLARLNERVLVPMLGDLYGTVLESGALQLYCEAGRFFVRYGKLKLPIRPTTYGFMLQQMDELLPSGDDRKRRLRELAEAFETLSSHDLEDRAEQLQGLKEELARYFSEDSSLDKILQTILIKINGRAGEATSFALLHDLLERQHYRLAHWKVGAHEVNYRRFFAVDTLVGLKMEKPEVFQDTHRLLGGLIASGAITGIRLDHIDGLWNPCEYLAWLEKLSRQKGAGSFPPYTLVEKILAPGENLPSSWAVHGTTGYEFAASLVELFIDSGKEMAWTEIYNSFSGELKSSRDLTYEDKLFILEEMFPNAVSNLAVELDSLVEHDWQWRDLSLHDLKTGLRHLLACLPVYRTYRMPGQSMAMQQRKWIDQAVAEAIRRNPCVDPAPIRFLGQVIMGDYPPPHLLDEHRPAFDRWVCKLQQATGAVMAKSVEDTHFFRYVRMLGVNEVGSHPARFGLPVEEFHRANALRLEQMPYCMLTTSTHDTKMSEDARARLFALAEIPEEWKKRLVAWHSTNESARSQIEDRQAPDAIEEYTLYQMLLAAWPLGMSRPDENFRQRIKAYLRKAQGEAKRNTAWTYPREEWHLAGERFIDAIFDSTGFLEDFVPFVKRISERGMIFSLAQTVLRLTSPGVPDLYQGNEIWDFSLVDPDNRRPVDFDFRRTLLGKLDSRTPEELLENWMDGGIKMKIIRDLLHHRRNFPQLFGRGEYRPIIPCGSNPDRVVAFLRRDGKHSLLVVVPRQLGEQAMLEKAAWDGLGIPQVEGRSWRNLFTGARIHINADAIPLSRMLSDWPVAVLASV